MFNLLKEGLEEAIAYERGLSKNVRVKKKRINPVSAIGQPEEYRASDIKNLRKKLDCSQSLLANYLNVSLNTVQAWEQGLRKPNHATLRLLEIVDKGPKFLVTLLGEHKGKENRLTR